MKAALTALLLCGCAAAAAGLSVNSDRLVEKPLNLLSPKENANAELIDERHHAGYFKLDRTVDAHMFYFYFEARDVQPDTPLVLWLTGGPGCSSELAVFVENGPYSVNDDLTLTETPFGWDTNHNMIFVDQPINTGFSYSSDPQDEVFDEGRVSQDMLEFLLAFFEKRPELKTSEFFITGESFGGHYIPVIAHHLWTSNKHLPEDQVINLVGIAIGNGLTVPSVQYGAYADFALDNDIISQSVHDGMTWTLPVCNFGLRLCDAWKWGWECTLALSFCQSTQFVPIMASNPGMNVYDIRAPCVSRLCYDFSKLDEYLNQDSVRAELGVGNRAWQECSDRVHADFVYDIARSYGDRLPDLLEDGIRVMIYAGDQDLICNWLGNRRWVDLMEWSGSSDWAAASDHEWLVYGDAAGTVKTAGPLTFVKVADAGHMVPMDQPLPGLDMITKFTRNLEFDMADDPVDIFEGIDQAPQDELPKDMSSGDAIRIMKDAQAARKYMGGQEA